MKPDFTLALSSEAIQLLHRVQGGWTLLGEAKLSDPDLADRLAALRARALGLAGGAPFGTKLLIPNEQIRYIALDTTRTTEDDVRAALDGTTPYSVDQLVYDFVTGGGRTYIAAVARQTLAEAEAFATAHQMAPLSFCASPEAFTYLGEAFFGPTRASRDILPFGTFLDRDPQPVTVIGREDGSPLGATIPPRAAPSFLAEMAVSAAAPDQHGAAFSAAEVQSSAAPEALEGTAFEPAAMPPETEAPTATLEPAPSAEPPASDPETPPTPESEGTRFAAPLPPMAASIEDPAAPAERRGLTLSPIEGVDTVTGDEGADSVTPEAPAPGFEAPPPRRITLTAPPQPLPEDAAAEPEETQRAEPAETTGEAPKREEPAEAAPAEAPTLFAAQPKMDPPTVEPGSFATRRDPTNPPKPAEAPAPEAAPAGFSTRRDPTTPPRAAAPAPAAQPPVTPPVAPPVAPSAASFATRREPTFPPSQAGSTGPALPPEPQLAAPRAPARPETEVTQVGTPLPPADPAPPAPPAPVASRADSEKTVIGQPLPAPTPPADSEKTVVGAPLPAADSLAVPQDSETRARPAPAGPVVTSANLPGGAAPSLRADTRATAAPADPAPARGGLFSRKRKAEAPAKVQQDARRGRTAFDTRQDPEDRPRVGGKPRFLGLFLTVLLLIFMAAVAAMAAFSEEGLAWLFGRDEDARTEVAAGPEAAPDLSGTAPDQPGAGTESAALPDLPGADGAPAAPSGVDALASAPEADDVPAHDPVSLPQQAATNRPVGQVLSPDEAQRIYAATGVWQRAPRLPLLPRGETLEDFQPAEAGAAPTRPELSGLPGTSDLNTDLALLAPGDPPPPGVDFPRDENGFILATPEGTATPQGAIVFAGTPPLEPPVRGGLPPEAAVAEAAGAEGVILAEDGLLVLAGAPPVAPPERPAAPLPEIAGVAEATTDEALVAEDGLVVLSGAPDTTPPVRPETEETATDLAETEAGDSTETEIAETAEPETPGVAEEDVADAPAADAAEAPEGTEVAGAEAADAPEGTEVAAADETAAEDTGAATEVAAAPLADGEAIVATDDLVVLAGAPDIAPPARTAPTVALPTAPNGREALILTDDLVVLTGAPVRSPPVRSPAAPAPEAEEDAALDPAQTDAAGETETAEADAAAADEATETAEAEATEEAPLAPADAALAGFRPAARPGTLDIPPGALLTPDPTLAGFRPAARPAGLAPPEAEAEADAEPEPETEPEPAPVAAPSPGVEPNAALAAAIASAVESAASEAAPRIVDATRQAVPTSRVPDARPRNFARVVDQARRNQQQAAARQQQQQQPRQQQQVAAAAPAPAPSSGPTPGGVAAAATEQNAINMRDVTLIGVYGSPSNRRALVRMGNGRYVKVSAGDRLDGGQVAVIGENYLDYQKRGRMQRLQMPAG